MMDSTDPYTRKTGLVSTLSISISKDKGNFTAIADTATEIQSSGFYEFQLSATEMNADVISILMTATGAKDRLITLSTES